jgi:hypothetical protein
MRQIIAYAHGNKAERYIVIGEGKLRPLPPLELDTSSVKDGLESLDWEGEVQCDESVTVGAFSVGDLSVKVGRNSSEVTDYWQTSHASVILFL